MAAPGILTGGNKLKLFKLNPTPENATTRSGMFADNPGVTPKYARNRGRRDAEYSDTIARLYIDLTGSGLNLQEFLNQLPAETRPLAQTLVAGGGAGGVGGTGFIDFVLTHAQEGFTEKTQIVNTLTDNYVAFYAGQEAPVFSYTGFVLNTYQDDQRVWLLRLYSDILRGTRLAQRNLIASLRYDSFLVQGYLENLMLSIQSETQLSGQFMFNMRVKQMSIHTPALALPTVSKNLSEGVLPAQTTTEQSTNNARAASTTTDTPPTAQQRPAAQSNADDVTSTKQIPVEPPNEIQQLRNDITNSVSPLSSSSNTSSTPNSTVAVTQADLLVSSGNPTNDGIGGISNIKNSTEIAMQAAITTTAPVEITTQADVVEFSDTEVQPINLVIIENKPVDPREEQYKQAIRDAIPQVCRREPTLADSFSAAVYQKRVPPRNRGAAKITPPANYLFEDSARQNTTAEKPKDVPALVQASLAKAKSNPVFPT